jgi:oligopeptide/dipeptide ABC transporter ATP-binding protein
VMSEPMQASTTGSATMSANENILEVSNLVMHFPLTSGIIFQTTTGYVHAIDGVSFSVQRGTTLGIVGESGSGKTTIGRCLVRLYKPTSGSMLFEGLDLSGLQGEALRAMRRKIQMIFQDPFASLNPRYSIGSSIGEPLRIHGVANGKQARERVEELLELVGLNPAFYDRYPHEFSGGQRQRIVIARAISSNPQCIIADEPVSALDVSIRAQILNLMQRIQRQLGLTYLFISHDLSVVRHVADKIAVMYLGKIMELADRDSIYRSPKHPYTQALLSAVPIPDPGIEKQRQRIILTGDLPSPINIPRGCRFHTRCPIAQQICREVEPVFEDKTGTGHFAACHFSEQAAGLTSTDLLSAESQASLSGRFAPSALESAPPAEAAAEASPRHSGTLSPAGGVTLPEAEPLSTDALTLPAAEELSSEKAPSEEVSGRENERNH